MSANSFMHVFMYFPHIGMCLFRCSFSGHIHIYMQAGNLQDLGAKAPARATEAARPMSIPAGPALGETKRRSVELPFGCFCKLGVLFLGALVIRALLFQVFIGPHEFWKLPFLLLKL